MCKNRTSKMKTVILGVIGADVHAVGNKILDHAFKEAGFRVINIGVLSSQQDFIEAAIEADADAILLSSLYGHGELDCQGFREQCIEAGLGEIVIFVGGNLVVGKHNWEEVEQRFLEMGFNRAYPPGTLPEKPILDLKKDLGMIGQV